MSQSEQINELAGALAKAQGSMQNAVMNRTNPHFRSKYADLSSVLDAIRIPLSAAGLCVVQTMHYNEHGMMVLQTKLMHSSGQFITTEYPLPNTTKPHEMGSALTYARRYSLAALICNASDEDDDGNAAQAAKNGNGHAVNGNGHSPDTPVSEAQLQELEALILEVNANAKNVCKACRVETLEDLTQVQFEKAKSKLEAMRTPL